ncbi:hypothetical protein AQUCO_00300338v1 [Aquilegia coerulea]|uniref:DUF3511 domain-containing protein n=1 Tax=Aquilegia coerulea TaxID=218851 RepID=A0A2G5EYF8_AQUCA|nr:hypothetical protein AQUCO_00300338v1 [Aquilegia coerulea]
MVVDFNAGYEPYGLSRKIEIVKGKEYSANQIYTTTTTTTTTNVPRLTYHHSSEREVTAESSSSPPPLPLRVSKPKKKKSSSSALSKWSMKDPEMKRRKRIATYKYYAVEGKVKSSFRKSFRWIKNKCSQIVNGF